MNPEIRWKLRFDSFEIAFKRLKSIKDLKELGELEKMALIQAFEYTFELSWKMLKDYHKEQGLISLSPKETIRTAFRAGYIKNSEIWMESIIKRNESSHTYKDEILESISEFIIYKFYPIVEDLYLDFKRKVAEE